MTLKVNHSVVTGAAANPDALVDGPAWDADHAITGLGTDVETALGVSVGSPGSVVLNGGALGTPISGTLTNCTSLPLSTGVTGAGTGVLTALATNVGSAGSVTINGGALGTPSSGTLTNATGLPIATGVSGLGTGIASFLATPSSANLRAALTDEVGTGAAYFVGGALGTPASATLTNATGLPVSTGVSGLGTGVATFLATPSSANLRSALTDETGTGAAVFATSPSITTPLITGITSGTTPASGLIGELITATASGVSVPTNTPTTITSITVSAGCYFVVGNVTVHANGSNALTEIHACLSDTTNALMGNPYGAPHAIHCAFIDGQDAIFPTGVAIWNFATSKTIYLVTNYKYTTGSTMTADGTIYAVRLI